MLVIRMQRTGRRGHAMFRIVVQDSRLSPTSGKVVARVGSYDPHAKTASIDKEKVAFYLEHGAQPSDRAARLIKAEGVKLPAWVKLSDNKKREVRNPDKRRSTRPDEPVEQVPAESETPTESEASAAEAPDEPASAEAASGEPAETNQETKDDAPAEEAEAGESEKPE